ncbi:DUF433 domain-containing protein [Nostoc sp. ChiQUE01b]|uniref:DUF433 domain-containing protein n=1 Tax=Nostoc sp. ChiQUE01b TaxID=3075376 RepID=UPI002AD485A8|nr:DUF433 domain-containing protein [Nostoc sp. ChiQUE01b]MDZ8257599.1 DUF433 domain-containing protein [Nostoc sp. ChiQUE01b]
MALASNGRSQIIRTERGLTIAGTRITLYQFMDYLHGGHSPQSFRNYFPQITDEQFDAAISYIDVNRTEVEAEYQIVLKQAEENRQYWEDRNREHFASIALIPSKPGREALWEKLRSPKLGVTKSSRKNRYEKGG